jgi:hypothetical protein
MRDGALLMCFECSHDFEGLIKDPDVAIAATDKYVVRTRAQAAKVITLTSSVVKANEKSK